MVRTTRDALIKALDNLSEQSFKRFCYKLSDWKIKEGFRMIHRRKLEMADRIDVVDLILSHYMYSYGPELTVDVLESINERQAALELKKDLENEKKHFVDRYREELIYRIPLIDPILDDLMARSLLTSEQYDTIQAAPTTEGKMRKLYSVIGEWSNTDKDILYNLLKKHNPPLIRDLEQRGYGISHWSQSIHDVRSMRWKGAGYSGTQSQGMVHFINQHSMDLIREVTMVDPMLDDLLQQNLLTQEQYDEIRSHPTSQKKMRDFYKYVRSWSDHKKVILYELLMKYNELTVKYLNHQDKQPSPASMVHFINQHSMDLIREVTMVDPMLDDLLQQNLLTQEQYDEIRSHPTSQKKMRDFYKYVRSWSDHKKVILYELLMKYNELTVKYLNHQDKQPSPAKMEHFVDRHREVLIQSIPQPMPILDGLMSVGLLTSEHYDTIWSEQTSREKMRMLYSYIRGWGNTDKDILYEILKKENRPLIRNLEENGMAQSLKPVKKHFVDRHRHDLINWVYELQPILDSLLNPNLLTKEQYDSICSKTTPQEKMTELYCLIEDWGDGDKDKLYDLLGKYNRLLIRDLEYKDMKWPLTSRSSSMSLDQSKWTPKDLLLYSLEYLFLDEFSHFKKELSGFVYYDKPAIPLGHLANADSMYISDKLIDYYGGFTALDVTVHVLKLVGLIRFAEELQEDIDLCGLRTPEVILVYILDKLEQYNFMQFKNNLSELCEEDKHPFPQRLKDSADRITTADLLILLNGKQEALNVTVRILHNIHVMRLARDLENWVSPHGSKKHAVFHQGEVGASKLTEQSSSLKPGSSKDFDFQAGMKIDHPDQSSVIQTGAEAQVSFKEENTQSTRKLSDLRCEMECPVCIDILSDPTTLMCGHNFCMKCIETAFNNQKKNNLFCPVCKQKYESRPILKINYALRKVARFFKSRLSKSNNGDLNCTYCIEDPGVAVKSCLLCETSLCDEHLNLHSKKEEHILIEPTTYFKERKCSIHNKVFEHYCTDDDVCVCSWCCIYGDHRDHQVEKVTKAAEKKKNDLRKVQEELDRKKINTEKLLTPDTEAQKVSDAELVRKLLEDLELISDDTSTQEDQASFSVSDLIKKAEERKDQMSHQIEDIIKICQETDPILFLQELKNAFCSESFQSHGEVLKILPEEASSSSHLDEIDCDLCGKDHDPDDTLVFPDINGNSYRLELTSAGLFRCSETGIKFQVKGPVTIEYELDSWDNYIAYLQHQGSEVLGPLFNIKTPQEPHIVCAVYLPHYLCLKELSEDTSWIRCAHFIDGNMSVEKPTRILPFHVVLENPSFSDLGVFCWNALPSAVTKRIPIHGRVLLYFRVIGKTCEEYQLHLYLVPSFAPISKDLEKEKQEMGYVKVDKPPRTRRTIYTEKNYIVKGPDEARIDPTELDVRCISPKDNFTDITIDAAVKTFGLDLVQEDSKDKVWGCHMSTGTIEQLWSDWEKNKRPEDQKESVDEHQRQPIEVSLKHEGSSCRDLLMSILDDMKDQSFKAFKACLNDGKFLRPHQKIPCADLEHADRLKVADLLVRRYTEEKAPDVTVTILEAIKEANLAKELRSKIGVK
ncbi:uncharacterized protein [Aquarana catesbeiana]|uniref:uncharacterized protein n=1 Tax=Aquarana catesbeiana TaxID=8400 RepID=UPI003CCA18B0